MEGKKFICLKCKQKLPFIVDIIKFKEKVYLKLRCEICKIYYIPLLKYTENFENSFRDNTIISKGLSKLFSYSQELADRIDSLIFELSQTKSHIATVYTEFLNNNRKFQSFASLLNECVFSEKNKLYNPNEIAILKSNIDKINLPSFINKVDNLQKNESFSLIERDIKKIQEKLNHIKSEYRQIMNSYSIITCKEENKSKLFVPKQQFCLVGINKNNLFFPKKKKLKLSFKIKSILFLDDNSIAAGNEDKLTIFSLSTFHKITTICGNFKKIYQLRHQKNQKGIQILSLDKNKFKIYDILTKKVLKTFNQFSEISSVLELNSGNILFVCNESIYQSDLLNSFRIPLNGLCYSMIQLHNFNLAYCEDNFIKIINLEEPKKVLKVIKGDFNCFFRSIIQINKDHILANKGNFIQLWNFDNNICECEIYVNFYVKELRQANNFWFFLGMNDVTIYDSKIKEKVITLKGLLNCNEYQQLNITTPFDVNKNELAFVSNETCDEIVFI